MDIQIQRARAIERTTELQLISDKRKWLPHEKEEFQSLLAWLIHDNARRYREEREHAQLKKKSPTEAAARDPLRGPLQIFGRTNTLKGEKAMADLDDFSPFREGATGRINPWPDHWRSSEEQTRELQAKIDQGVKRETQQTTNQEDSQ